MKIRNPLVQIPKTRLLASVMAGLAVCVLSSGVQAQTINFNAPGGLGAANYSGQGAYADTNHNYWNPIKKGGTTPAGTNSDGVTISAITMTDTSPNNYGNQGANGTPEGLQAPFLLENSGTPVVETLNNVPAGTYQLYLYGLNGGGNGDRGATFTVSNAFITYAAQSTVGLNAFLPNNKIPNTNFSQGVNYVRYKVVMQTAGALTFTYAANTNIVRPSGLQNQDYSGVNREGDFNGVQLVYVSSSTTPPPNTLNVWGIYPNGTNLFQPASRLSFTASSVDGVVAGGVSVQLTGTNANGTTGYTTLLTGSSGLTTAVDGTGTNLTVSAPLTNNFFYTASIHVSDADGYVTNYTFAFDTINASAAYTVEAEDYDFGGGQFINNPAPDAYAGSTHNATQGVDINDPNNASETQAYGRSGLETQITGDKPRAAFSGFTDYEVGVNNNGNWANYTRTYPKGPFVVYLRATSSAGGSDSATLSLNNGGTLTSLGTFSVPASNSVQTYAWVPLLDANNKLAVFVSAGNVPETLRATVDGGGYNANFLMLVSVNTNSVAITNIYPTGANQFQATNVFSFTINATDPVATTNILVTVAGTNLLGQIFGTNLTGAALSISGSANSQIVNIPLNSNAVYGVSVQVTDDSGIMVKTNLNFDTVTPAYIFEVEDYNYTFGGTGLWADPFVDGTYGEYQSLPATLYIDYYDKLNASGTNEQSSSFRGIGGQNGQPLVSGNEALDTENCGDVPHLTVYANPAITGDYDSGNATAGNWGNYTRIYPAGTYNVFMRAATPNAPVADALNLSLVTGDTTTSNQTATNILGTFAVNTTGDWQKYAWVPLTHNGGQPVQVTFDGTSTYTLRATWDSSGFNVNYFMLMPADTTLPVISNLYPDGAHQFESSGNLAFTAVSSAGFATNQISVQLTGTNLLGQVFSTNYTVANGLVTSGSATSLNISVPLASNTVYSATITVVAANGKTTVSSVSFDTVAPTFLFEAEDFNYGGGQFINGSLVNAYSNLSSIVGIDYTNVETGTGNSAYRPQGLETETAADIARTNYSGGLQDYNIGYAAGGNWANYTRVFPAGIYNIYLRGANGNNNLQTDAASLSLVNGATTTSQMLTQMGTFSVPGTNGAWQVYHDVPLIDADGNYAQFVSNGGQQTLRVTTDGGSYNANYYLLMPADTTLPVNPPHLNANASGTSVVVSFLTRTNTTYQLLFKSNLTDATWTPVGSRVPGNSLNKSLTNSISGSSGFYRLQTIE